jgi:alkylation response protein AidB-like acyl-CoA dehydrogenase
MLAYQAPLRDIRFVLHELLGGAEGWAGLPAHAALTPDTVDAVLEAAARFCGRELLPLAGPGDEEGCRLLPDGEVRTPAGFREAYRLFREGGWASLACDPADGGQGLPEAVNLALTEMVCSTNLAFGTYAALTRSAYLLLAAHGSGTARDLHLAPLAEGRWCGTMCMTEPQCGTDLGLIRTRAEPAADGSHRITGTKIFITAGEHDLAENIVHLVLARLPDAPEGTRGLSLFLVPKLLARPDGRPGERNRVRCLGLERKMGLHASATCTLAFEGAEGRLVGERDRGLRAMFTMMNVARLAVGVQGLGLAETAYQNALAHARERRQGRAVGAGGPDAGPAPIVAHPDVRRMLLRMRAFTEGARALVLWIGREVDVARHHPDPGRRQEADELVQLMTPVVKSLLTDEGFAAVNLGLQVFGGHGYVREHGMERLVREARIGQLYEGTNGVQALDLVGRKLRVGHGRLARRFFHPVSDFLEAHAGAGTAMGEFVEPLARAFRLLQETTAWLGAEAARDPAEGAAAASDYLRLLGLVALGYVWARTAERALGGAPDKGEGGAAFYAGKLATARFFTRRVLPETAGLALVIRGGGATIAAGDAL